MPLHMDWMQYSPTCIWMAVNNPLGIPPGCCLLPLREFELLLPVGERGLGMCVWGETFSFLPLWSHFFSWGETFSFLPLWSHFFSCYRPYAFAGSLPQETRCSSSGLQLDSVMGLDPSYVWIQADAQEGFRTCQCRCLLWCHETSFTSLVSWDLFHLFGVMRLPSHSDIDFLRFTPGRWRP